jgi:hypothetical protein
MLNLGLLLLIEEPFVRHSQEDTVQLAVTKSQEVHEAQRPRTAGCAL